MPVVLVSGLAANHRSWGLQLVDLKKNFQLITIDNRGIGKSKGALDGLTIEDMAADVGELLSMLNVERVHLIGFSMGGMITLEYAARNPEKGCSIVLSSLPIFENLGPFDAFSSELNSVLAAGDPENLFQTLASMYFSSDFLNERRYYRWKEWKRPKKRIAWNKLMPKEEKQYLKRQETKNRQI